MDEQIAQLNERVEELEVQLSKNIFSNRDVNVRFNDFQGQLKIPKFSATPSVCEVGQICSVSGDLYICSAIDTWTQIQDYPVDFSQNYSSFTAGETLALGDPVRLSTGTKTIFSMTDTGTTRAIDYDATYAGVAQQFTVLDPGMKFGTIAVKFHKNGSGHADGLKIALVNDSSGNPTGSEIESTTKNAADIATSATVYTFTFTSTLNAGTYWITITRTGATDGTNNYVITGKSEADTSSARYANNNINWKTINSNRHYTVITSIDGTEGQVVKALATYDINSKAIGLAKTAITSSQSGSIVLFGIATGLTSLTTGSLYYLSDTGTLSTTAGTKSRILGRATSSTSLLVNITQT